MAKKSSVKIKKQDGGYLFPDLGIHVVAEDEEAAKALVKQYHGIDVDKVDEPEDSKVTDKKAKAKG